MSPDGRFTGAASLHDHALQREWPYGWVVADAGKRPGWFARLLGKAAERAPHTVTRTTRIERLNLTVPSAKAEAVRTAVDAWLLGRGVSAKLLVEETSDGNARLSAQFEDNDRRIDLSENAVQSELQSVLKQALHDGSG